MNKPLPSVLQTGSDYSQSMPSSTSGDTSRRTGGQAVPTLSSYLRSILARKWTVLLTTALIALLGAFIISSMTPIYRANAVLNIQTTKNSAISFEELIGAGVGEREFLQTQTEFIRSREVRSRVAKAMDLVNNPRFDPTIPTESLLIKSLRRFEFLQSVLPEEPKPIEYEPEEIEALIIQKLKDDMNVSSVRKSNLLEITFDSPDPALASKVTNTFTKEYIRADLDARFDEQQNASQWLNSRLAELQSTLEGSENELQTYREKLGLIATPSASMGGTVRTLDSAGDNLLRARMEAASLRQVFRQVRKGARNRFEVPEVFNNPAVASARAIESTARNKFVELQQQLGPAHPELIAAKNEFEAASQTMRRQSEAVIQSISKRYEVARTTVGALERTLASSRENIQEVNRKESQLTVLEREVATNRQIYDAFLTKVKETDATSDFRTPVARVVDPAVPPTDPAKPAKAQLFLLSLLGGLLAGCLLAVSLEAGSNTVRNSDDVEAQIGVPLLATAPIVKGNIAETDSIRLISLDAKSPFAESVRTAVIGTKLACLDIDKPVFSFLSSMPAEGKTTMACNFAIEQARTSKTILIEADMRKPVFMRRFKLNREKPGVAEALQGESLTNCTQFVPELNLAVLPAAKASPTALDLLMSDNLPKLIDELKKTFDVIVFDNPPLELVSDGLAVCRHSTGVIMVVKSGSTPMPMIKRNVSRVKNAGINIFGIVLNHHDFHRASRYYGEESGQGKYGSSYYYG